MQDGIKDCGVCCLLSIVRYYGGNVSKEYLKELTATGKNGVSAYQLIQGAETLGFQAIGLEGEVEQIRQEDLPCIAHIVLKKSYQHFVVIYDLDLSKNKILIMDPAKGKNMFSLSEFKLLSSQRYIFLKPRKALPKFTVNKIVFLEFGQVLSHHRILVLSILGLSFCSLFLAVCGAYHFQYLLNYAIQMESIQNAYTISFMMLLLFLVKEFSQFLFHLSLMKWNNFFDFHLTRKILEQIISFPYLYYKNRTTGEVLARIKDLNTVKNFLTNFLCICIPEFFSFSVFFFFLIKLNWSLTGYLLVFFLFFLWVEFLFRSPKKKKIKKCLRLEEKLNSQLIEILSGFDVIKGLHLEENTIQKVVNQYHQVLESEYVFSRFSFCYEYVKNNLHQVMMVLFLLLGSIQVIKGEFSLSNLLLFQSIFLYTIMSFQRILKGVNNYQEYKVAKERIEELFTIQREDFSMQEYYVNQKLIGDIEYRNFTFSYQARTLFSSFQLKIPYGSTVFFYGESGNGKSTLVKALLRYIKVPFGQLMINHIDINHYPLATLRKKIAYISQNEMLFTGSILDNLTLGRKIREEEYQEAIEKMGLSEVIERLPLGLATILEENGSNFSGGERQRIILARSILKKSDIYIFDEATEQIDSKKEREILINLLQLLKGKTILFVSHRFDNKDLFSRVIRLEKGKSYEEKI